MNVYLMYSSWNTLEYHWCGDNLWEAFLSGDVLYVSGGLVDNTFELWNLNVYLYLFTALLLKDIYSLKMFTTTNLSLQKQIVKKKLTVERRMIFFNAKINFFDEVHVHVREVKWFRSRGIHHGQITCILILLFNTCVLILIPTLIFQISTLLE